MRLFTVLHYATLYPVATISLTSLIPHVSTYLMPRPVLSSTILFSSPTQMSLRTFDHLLHYGELPVKRVVPLALALLYVSNPDYSVIDQLSRLSHDQVNLKRHLSGWSFQLSIVSSSACLSVCPSVHLFFYFLGSISQNLSLAKLI